MYTIKSKCVFRYCQLSRSGNGAHASFCSAFSYRPLRRLVILSGCLQEKKNFGNGIEKNIKLSHKCANWPHLRGKNCHMNKQRFLKYCFIQKYDAVVQKYNSSNILHTLPHNCHLTFELSMCFFKRNFQPLSENNLTCFNVHLCWF